MKQWQFAFLSVVVALLSGCASTIKNQVTTFHEWPNYVQDKTYVFERTREQDNDLEYRNYENLVRGELRRLGFEEASNLRPARLKASLGYSIRARDVRVSYPVVMDPYLYGPSWRGYYGPFYDPFWFGPPIVERREESYQLFTRQLRFTLANMSDGKKVYDSTVVSEGTNGALAKVMPYMVRAAFEDFPGRSGVPRVVELKMK
ncbi:MAG: hypothetical protein JWM42_787 [Burkholderia sp.]|jgi:hypothetical protein|nr:hypothetical protein [Burkholderia sp.]